MGKTATRAAGVRGLDAAADARARNAPAPDPRARVAPPARSRSPPPMPLGNQQQANPRVTAPVVVPAVRPPANATAAMPAARTPAAAPTGASPAPAPAAAGADGGARAGPARDVASDDADVGTRDLDDLDAVAGAQAEWHAEPTPSLAPRPISEAFFAPAAIALIVMPKPPPPGKGAPAKPNAANNESALRIAADAYANVAAVARAHHDALVDVAEARQRELIARIEMSLARVDDRLAPTIDALRVTLDDGRRALDDAAAGAEATIAKQAARARRMIYGAAAGARQRIAAAAAAAEGQLPAIGTGLRERFEKTYGDAAAKIKTSGETTGTSLASEEKKTATANAIPEGDNATVKAQTEAKRKVIPSQMDALAAHIKTQSAAQAKATTDRMTTAPEGGMSLAGNIDAFVNDLRKHIAGGTEGGKTTKSMAQRGNDAVDRAQSQALSSLAEQVKDAQRAVRHARASGEQQIATQRGAALTRLTGLRRGAVGAMRAQAHSALGTIAKATATALPLYGDAAKRVETTLRDTAASGPAALTRVAQTAPLPVLRSLADGRMLQSARLAQVARGADQGVSRQGDDLPLDAERAAQEFAFAMRDIASDIAADINTTAVQQTESLHTAARGVAASAEYFTQPIAKMYADSIASQVKALDPVHAAEEKAVTADAKRITDDHAAKLAAPTKPFADTLERIAASVDGALETRKKNARVAIDKIDLDEDALMAAFRALTPLQAKAVEYKYDLEFPSLRAFIEEQHDATASGLNDDEYNSIKSALDGDPVAAARYELKTTVHWYGNEHQRAAEIMDSLSDKDLKKLTGSAEWAPLSAELKSGMYGSNLQIFEALEANNRARAEAVRTKDRIDAARDANDHLALQKAVTELGASYNDRATLNPDEVAPSEADRRAAIQREFATLPGVQDRKPAVPLTQDEAAAAFATYATRDVTVERDAGGGDPMGGGGGATTTFTYHLDDVTTLLITAIAKGGPDSKDAKAARILYEGEKGGGDKPDLAALEAAAVDPRLNPTLTPDLTKEQRDAARAEQNEVYLRYAEMARANHVPGAPASAEEARRLAAARLGRRYDDSESGRLGANYVASIVTQDRPDPVVAMRFAMLGAGTDVPLIRRTLQRLSRDEIDKLHADYNTTYGGDMFADLGVFGKGILGDVSGDDRLKIEQDLNGVPRNERERMQLAIFTNQQQFNERGILDVNAGTPEERSLLEARTRLRDRAGGAIALDEYGRPTIVGGNFDRKTGRYTGADRDAFFRDLNYAQTSADIYTARIDRIASYATTGIAIIGAIVAAAVCIATGGAALPLMAVALGAGLASMAANAAIRGGRYGWEEAAVDLAMTAVQTLTAGIGAQLGAASKVAIEAAKEAGVAAAQITRMAIVNAVRIGATTGAIGGVAGAALNEKTWEHGIGSGLALVFEGGLKGALSGAVTAAVTNGIEGIGRGEATLGNKLAGMSASGGVVRGSMSVLGRGLGRSALNAAGGMAGRGSEILFDTATGRFQGSRRDALASIGEAGTHSAFQGFFEGAAEAGGQRYHDARNRPPAAARDDPARRAVPAPDAEGHPPAPRPRPGEPELPGVHPATVRPDEPHAATARPAPADHETATARPPPPEHDPAKVAAPPTHAGGDDGGGPPRAPPRGGGGGGDGDRLFPNITDAEMDALFAHAEAGPHLRAPADELALRLPRAQGGEYWGLDPARRMTVQEFQFLAQRGMPPLDAAGNPIAGPLGSKRTQMRIHSPDPTAPPGSASRSGWTVSIVQGNLRMTADGRWFHVGFGETPTGKRIAVDGYRRGPAGDWVEAATGRRVVDADVHAALDQWDRNMAASHIPLFPSAGGGRLPPLPATPPAPPPPPPMAPPPPPAAPEGPASVRAAPDSTRVAPPAEREAGVAAKPLHEDAARRPTPAQTEPGAVVRPAPHDEGAPEPPTRATEERTAAGIAGARLAGDAAKRMNLPETHMGTAQAAARQLAGPGGTFEGRMRVVDPPGEPMQITLLARTPHEADIPVRLLIVDDLPRTRGEMPAARYDPDPDVPGGYVVKVSRGTPRSEAERALAHELAEIRAVHGTDGKQVDALGSGGVGRRLSPHDEGRLAELDVMARQLAALPDHPDSGPTRRRLLDEAQRLADHLGLLGEGPAVENRRALAMKALAELPETRALLAHAVETAVNNPFLQRPSGKIDEDLALFARQLEHARSLDDNPRALKLREAAILEQAAEAVQRDRLVVTRESRKADGRLTYESEPLRIQALRDTLPPDQQRLLDHAVALAKQLPPYRETARVPTKGLEARFATEPAARPEFDLPGDQKLRVRGKNGAIEEVTVDQAVDRRRGLIDDQRVLRAELADPATSSTRKAAIDNELRSMVDPINRLSEALGEAAGRRFIANDPDLRNGRIIEMPRAGSGVPDLLVEMPPHPGGPLVLVECKGGESGLGVRKTADQRRLAQQGNREYAVSLAEEMVRSTDPAIKALGERLRLQLAAGTEVRYFLVQQRFDDSGNPTSPEVGEFDIARRSP
ncbi:MAG: hypothetical protein U1F15_02005 [Burkholderiales bacterium]